MFRRLYTTLLGLLLWSSQSYSIQLDVDITGLSYHIGANSSNPAWTGAPRGLDKNGAFVVNPGIGLGLDFRKNSRDAFWYGFSPVIKAVYLRDCDDRSWAMFFAGTRYRYMFVDNWSADLNLGLSIINSEEWDSKDRLTNFNPYYSLGMNYHFQNNATVGMTGSVIPRNKDAGNSISGFNILFLSIYLSYPL